MQTKGKFYIWDNKPTSANELEQAHKTAAVSRAIIAEHRANGGDIRAALDKVCGAGTFDKLAGDVYDAFRVMRGAA